VFGKFVEAVEMGISGFYELFVGEGSCVVVGAFAPDAGFNFIGEWVSVFGRDILPFSGGMCAPKWVGWSEEAAEVRTLAA
jgi:hypothetical protein